MQGLSEEEVSARRARGEDNAVPRVTSRSYKRIIAENAFTPINDILYVIAIFLIALGVPSDAVLTVMLVVANVVVGVVQEARAKRQLDRITLLTRPDAKVIRSGHERSINPDEIVRGDLLVVRPGDQIQVDGTVQGDGVLSVDESLLTGEADLVEKRRGDPVYSGSFCISGSGLYEAERVGSASMAQQLTEKARSFRDVKTPLQREVNLATWVLAFVMLALGVEVVSSSRHISPAAPLVENVRAAAVLAALVPQGLSFMVTMTYAMATIRLAGKGALIQRINAVESASHIQVLCLDKTGTLTTNHLRLHALEPIGIDEAELRRRLGDYAASSKAGNRTTEAIAEACGGQQRPVHEEVPFSSARKWSALSFDDPALTGTYLLGAPEMLQPGLLRGASAGEMGHQWATSGLRVLLFAERTTITPFARDGNEPQLPSDLQPLGLLSLSDDLRPDARETILQFAKSGIALKIISGDSPETVAALATQAGLANSGQSISGLALEGLSEKQLEETAEEKTVFGRITPQQKEQLVEALRRRGHYVAMTGDGVNDVLALKQAHLAIAMRSGSEVTRSIADIVLLDDSFPVLPLTFREGQRIRKGMQDIIRLFLVRPLSAALIILAVSLLGHPFPITPGHNAIVAVLTIGIPVLALAAWARPGSTPRHLLPSAAHFVLPAAVTIAAVGLTMYLFYLSVGASVAVARTALTTTIVLCGITLIPFVQPPSAAWAGGSEVNGDRRAAILALALVLLYIAVLAVPPLREFYGLALLPAPAYAMIVMVVFAWAVALRWIWRLHPIERLRALRRPRAA